MSTAEDRAPPFEEAHPTLVLTADDGEQVEIPRERMPRLLGWQVLLQPWRAPQKTRGGILLPDDVQDANEFMTYVFKVVALGPLAFTHPRLRGGERHGSRRLRKERDLECDADLEFWREDEWTSFAPGVQPPSPGDWVIVRKFSGIRLNLNGVPLKLCNDDDILAVIDSPSGWQAYVG